MYTLNFLKPDSTYEIKIAAQNSEGKSLQSQSIQADTPADVPDQVEGLEVTSHTDFTIAIKWTEPHDNGARVTGYTIEWEKLNPQSNLYETQESVEAVETYYAFTLENNLKPEITYRFRVSAVNSIGTGELSEPVS